MSLLRYFKASSGTAKFPELGGVVLEWPSAKIDHEIFEDCHSAKIGPLENFPLYSTLTVHMQYAA